MSTLKLQLAQIEDLEALARLDRDAWLPNEHPMIMAMFQHEETPHGFQNKIAQWKASHRKVPNERHFTVVDTTTGEMVLSARALIPCSGQDLENFTATPKISGPFWDSEDDRAWAEHLSQRYTQRRRDAFRKAEGKVFGIKQMAVDPRYQKKGAGSVFIRWITDQADDLGYECVVESALRAEGFYKKHGFRPVERCAFPPAEGEERWRGKGTQEYVWMVRPPRKRTEQM